MIRIVTIGCVVLLAGCSKSAPDCSSGEATDLVIKIAEGRPYVVGFKMTKSNVVLSVDSISTLNHDSDTGRYECSAELQVTGVTSAKKEFSRTFPITYTTAITDDGEKISVSLSGI